MPLVGATLGEFPPKKEPKSGRVTGGAGDDFRRSLFHSGVLAFDLHCLNLLLVFPPNEG